MFTPIHLLPQTDSVYHSKYRSRWETDQGKMLHDKIMKMIKNGAGDDFLVWDFQHRELGFLEHEHDLRGFKFRNENIVFPDDDETFKAIDFSFAEFWDTKMTNALFNCTMNFTKFHRCIFQNCMFSFNNCYASHFRKIEFIDCDFVEHNSLTNCSFIETSFTNAFFSRNVFFDCKFDTETVFTPLPFRRNPVVLPIKNHMLENSMLSDLYKGIREAYIAGGSVSKTRRYLFLQLQASTRYNSESFMEKIWGLFFEYLAGHGLRPLRVIRVMALWFILAFTTFFCKLNFRDALLLTCGALFTFGAKADILDHFGILYLLVYIASSFIGISLTALFITVLVNVLMRDK